VDEPVPDLHDRHPVKDHPVPGERVLAAADTALVVPEEGMPRHRHRADARGLAEERVDRGTPFAPLAVRRLEDERVLGEAGRRCGSVAAVPGGGDRGEDVANPVRHDCGV